MKRQNPKRRPPWGRTIVAAACGWAIATTPAMAGAAAPASRAPAATPAPPAPRTERDDLYPPSMMRPRPLDGRRSSCEGVDRYAPVEERRAAAQAEAARAHALYEDDRYDEALEAIDRAACHHEEPEQDFMRVLVHAARHECTEARLAMIRYIGSGPAWPSAVAARKHSRACAHPPPPPTAAREVVLATTDDGPAEPPPVPEPRDHTGTILAAVGVGGLIGGSTLVAAAGVLADPAKPVHVGYYQSLGALLIMLSTGVLVGTTIRHVRARRGKTIRREALR